ncbi:hypothetical protein A9Q98_02405 [Thalassotalea sp. 42_200_T64]|nr:hypothetical protein A9Q98_02405 [Thalassotalea sp. 42_200_T64]
MIKSVAESKKITDILHFTSNSGLLGILASGAVLPNSELKEEDTLAFVFKQNSEKRKERNLKWLKYVNLSVTKLNKEFFSYSENRHRSVDQFWCILSFSPSLLNDDGVFFTTTNNIYPSCLRGEGVSAFGRMFNNSIEGKFQKTISRTIEHKESWTTCEQAEILYPGKLSLDYLQSIYVKDIQSKHIVKSQLAALNLKHDVVVCPAKFK